MIDRIANGRTDLVFDHVSGGKAATLTDKNGVSLIKWCAYYGDVSAIKFLIANGESLASLGDNFDLNGISPGAVSELASDHGMGWGGMDANLLGKPQV